MRIAIAQLDFTVGDFAGNLALMRGAVAQAAGQAADLVVFSELATTGYPPGDLLERRDFVDRNLVQLEHVAALSAAAPAILVGYVDRNESGAGKPLHNAAALCRGGRVVERTVKTLLPTYDVFDEARYFEPAGELRPLELDGCRLGVTICEDVWSDPELWQRRLYRRDPVRELAAQGVDLLVNLSASPFSLGKAEQRRQLIRSEAREHGRPFVYVNQVGGNDELLFDGHSLAVDASGAVIARAWDFAADLVVLDLAAPHSAPLRPVAGRLEEEAYRALVLGVRDYVRKSGFRRVVLGLSGGIDSALTATVACDALGPDNVLGIAMPTRYSSPGSVADARSLAAKLGLDFRLIPVDAVFQSLLDGLQPSFAGLAADVTEENLQARVRGTVLMAFANKHGLLLLSTGNKSEVAVGYCTLYGDMCGALAVISDVPKTLVYRLARLVNEERERIPVATLTKPPSAELRPNQTDQDSLPPYEVLDEILAAYVERLESVADMVARGLDEATVRRVVRLIDGSEYKRRQAAPGIKITAKAFGVGRRYPVVARHDGMHEGAGEAAPGGGFRDIMRR